MVALEARRRVLGLSKKMAAHEKAATVLGRLWLAGEITESMREAGERYLEIYLAAMRALKAPMGLAATGLADIAGGASGYGGGEIVSEDYIVWATKRVAVYETMKAALRDADLTEEGSSGIVESVVHRVIVEDMRTPETWLPSLRTGLGHLAKKLGVGAVA